MHVSSSIPKAARSLANVQRRLLQCHVPDFDNVECRVMYRPAEIVGGDFYDVLRLPTGELGIAIGDVSGKGLEAALMMASVQATEVELPRILGRRSQESMIFSMKPLLSTAMPHCFTLYSIRRLGS